MATANQFRRIEGFRTNRLAFIIRRGLGETKPHFYRQDGLWHLRTSWALPTTSRCVQHLNKLHGSEP